MSQQDGQQSDRGADAGQAPGSSMNLQTAVAEKFRRFCAELSPDEQQALSALLSTDGAAEVEGYLFSPFSRAPSLIGGPLAAGSKLAPFGPPISAQVNGTANPTPGQPYPTGFTPVVPEPVYGSPDFPS